MAMNPFKPTAGKMPPVLIGRQSVISDFIEGLDNGAGAPGRLMLVTGQRGYGKTVMLTEFARVAASRGWEVYSDTASPGLCNRLMESLSPVGLRLESLTVGPSVSIPGVAAASLGGATLGTAGGSSLTLRLAIEKRLKRTPKGKGILFTVDEVQAASMDDLVALATALQHVIRDQDLSDLPDSEKHGVAFAFAALPSLMDELLHDKVLTFLRRSLQRDLSDILLPDVRDAYIEVVEGSGKSISLENAFLAARFANGYPYMIQLVGYYMWRAAEARGSQEVEERDVRAGSIDAEIAFEDAVCAPLFSGLTAAQKLFVSAVAIDDPEPARMADIAHRVARSASWASKYRASLIQEKVVEPVGHGLVRLSTPHLAAYIRKRC